MRIRSTELKQLTIRNTFASLKYPNYRLWFYGQLVSLAGTWMQNTAQGYLVYELTGSSAYLGFVGFAAGLPTWLFTLFGGAIADRFPRRTTMIITQSVMMVLAFILAGMVYTKSIQPWHIVILAFLLGTANAFDAPARVSFVAELVDRNDMTNAIALNATMFNSASIIGPVLAGWAYSEIGPTWCFMLNGLSFLAVITALALMKLPRLVPDHKSGTTISQIKQGLRYTTASPVIRTLILSMGMLSLFGFSLMTLLPAWTSKILGGDARMYGLLLSGRGIGAVIGALMIAALGRTHKRGKLWTIGNFLIPLSLAAFAMARWLPLSMVTIILMGWSLMVQANTSNALTQTHVSDELRGRVMSIYTLIFFGGMPLGALLSGTIAEKVGEPYTLLANAIVLFLFAGFVRLRLPFVHKLE